MIHSRIKSERSNADDRLKRYYEILEEVQERVVIWNGFASFVEEFNRSFDGVDMPSTSKVMEVVNREIESSVALLRQVEHEPPSGLPGGVDRGVAWDRLELIRQRQHDERRRELEGRDVEQVERVRGSGGAVRDGWDYAADAIMHGGAPADRHSIRVEHASEGSPAGLDDGFTDVQLREIKQGGKKSEAREARKARRKAEGLSSSSSDSELSS
jgi:hypothetical protein